MAENTTLLRQAMDALHPQANRAFVEVTRDALRAALAAPVGPVARKDLPRGMCPGDLDAPVEPVAIGVPVGWIDEFGNVFPLGAWVKSEVREKWKPLYTTPPAQPAPAVPAPFDRTTALVLLQAASKSGDPGAISLAAQLAGAAPCTDCGYVNFKCRCAAPADTRKLCTCDGAGRGPGRACVVQAGGRLGDLWKCSKSAAPAVRESLTDAAITRLMPSGEYMMTPGELRDFARAIERAHGITGDSNG